MMPISIRAGYDSMGMRVSCIFQSQFFAGFFFFFFGRRLFRSDLKHLVQNLQKLIPDLDSSRKITQFQKKNGSNRSPDVGDIADLKSAILSEFL